MNTSEARNLFKGEAFVVSEDDMRYEWSAKGKTKDGRRIGLACGFCVEPFEIGDTARWVYVDGAPNTFTCVTHDGPDVAERFRERWLNEIVPILRRYCPDY